MKIKLNQFFILFIGALVFSSSVMAQRGGETQYANPLLPSKKPTPIYFGPAGGVNITQHPMTMPTICNSFEQGVGIGLYGGITLERLFGDVATSSSSIIFRLLFNMYPGSDSREDVSCNILPTTGGNPVEQNVKDALNISYNAVTFEAMYKINPIPAFGLGIVVGPAIDYIITKTKKWTYELTTKGMYWNQDLFREKYPYVTFEDGQTAVMYDGEVEDASSIRFGVKAGVQYEILLGSKLYVAPAIVYNFGITPVTSQHSWRVNALQVGIDARFAF